jgi:Cu/Ag efflux pump CusA
VQVPSNPSLLVEILVIGKVILIAEALKFGNRFSLPVPIASIAMRSLVFAILLLIIHILENTIEAWWHGKSILQAIFGATSLREALITTAVITIGLIPYQAFKEIQILSRDIDLISRLLGRQPAAPQ